MRTSGAACTLFTALFVGLICLISFAAYLHTQAMRFPLLNIIRPITDIPIPPPMLPAQVPVGLGRENATLLVLCRESDMNGILYSMESVEKRFNAEFGYPWTFLNDKPFSDEFKQKIQSATKSPVSFGVIPKEHWAQPDWIDEYQAEQGRMRMKATRVPYAGSVSYRNMCRFNSGFFFHHPLVQGYRYYWRVEPDIRITCDVPYDPFKFMREEKKVYGFTITIKEFEATIENLWGTVREFLQLHPQYAPEDNAMDYLSDDGGVTYNLCHFWSNFEIGDMDFWRSEAYQKFFAFLEAKGGFYYERWGDAPVHSIGAALFAHKEQLHYFQDIGYFHHPLENCPTGKVWGDRNCECGNGPNTKMSYKLEYCTAKHFSTLTQEAHSQLASM